MNDIFVFNKRLGIELPSFKKDWDEYSDESQQQVLLYWENVRGAIPDRIIELEHRINGKQAELDIEDNFQRSCLLNTEIADLASVINDLWLWYRTNQDVTKKGHL